MLRRVRAILAACQAWKVEVITFPEYSVPWQILEDMAHLVPDIVVVAGTHAVDRAALNSNVYGNLGWSAPAPAPGMAVSPVLYQNRLVGLQSKLHSARQERKDLQLGKNWQPIPLGEGLPGPMGVMICLDFLTRESSQHRDMVGPQLSECRFLAVPSLTPTHTLSEFAAKTNEEARRYARPVLYSNIAKYGGTSVYVDDDRRSSARTFPQNSGCLEPGEEGVIISDIDMSLVPRGKSSRYGEGPVVRPFAAASLIYNHDAADQDYIEWLEDATPLLGGDGWSEMEGAVTLIENSRERLQAISKQSQAPTRTRRLSSLLVHLDKVTRMEELRQYIREVVMPPDVLSLALLQATMAKGATQQILTWLADHHDNSIIKIAERVSNAAQALPSLDALSTQMDECVQAIIRDLHPGLVPPLHNAVDDRSHPEAKFLAFVEAGDTCFDALLSKVQKFQVSALEFGNALLEYRNKLSKIQRRTVPSYKKLVNSFARDLDQFSRPIKVECAAMESTLRKGADSYCDAADLLLKICPHYAS